MIEQYATLPHTATDFNPGDLVPSPMDLLEEKACKAKPIVDSTLNSLRATTITDPTEVFESEKASCDSSAISVNLSGTSQDDELIGSAPVFETAILGLVDVSQDTKVVSIAGKLKKLWSSELLLLSKGLFLFKKQMPAAPSAKAEFVRPRQPVPKKLKSSQNNHDAHFKATKKWSKIFVELRQMKRHEACYRQRTRVCEWDECPVERNGARRISAHRAYCCSLSAAHALKRFVFGRQLEPKLVILNPYFSESQRNEVTAQKQLAFFTKGYFESECADYRDKVIDGYEVSLHLRAGLNFLRRPRSNSHPDSVTIFDLYQPGTAKSVSDFESESCAENVPTSNAPVLTDFLTQAKAESKFEASEKNKSWPLLICAAQDDQETSEAAQLPAMVEKLATAPDINVLETCLLRACLSEICLSGAVLMKSTQTISSPEEATFHGTEKAGDPYVYPLSKCHVYAETASARAAEHHMSLPEDLLPLYYDFEISLVPSDESIASEVFEDIESSDEDSYSESASGSSSVYSEVSFSEEYVQEPKSTASQEENWSHEGSEVDDTVYQENALVKSKSLEIPKFRNKRFVRKLETITESRAANKPYSKDMFIRDLPQMSLHKFFLKKASQIERLFANESKAYEGTETCEPIFEKDSQNSQEMEDILSNQETLKYEQFDSDCWVRDPKSMWWHELGLEESFVPKLATGAAIDLQCVCINLKSIQKSSMEVAFNNYVTNMKFKVVKCAQEPLRLEHLEVGEHLNGAMDKSIKGSFRTFIEIGDMDMTTEFSASEAVLQQYELMCVKSRSSTDAEAICTQLSHMKAVILAQDKIMGKCQESLLVHLENYDLIEKYMYLLMGNVKAAAGSFYNYCVEIGNHEKTTQILAKLKACFIEVMDDLLLMGKMEASVYEGIQRIEGGFTTRLEHILGNYEKAFSFKMVFHELFRNAYRKNINCGELTKRQLDSFIGCESDDEQVEFMDKCRVQEVQKILLEKLLRLKTQHQMVRELRAELQLTFEDISLRFLAQVFE